MAQAGRLYGLRALVVNGGSGIGEACARTFAKHGAEVVAADSANSGVEQHFKSVKGIDGHAASISESTRMPALIEAVVERFGRIDILINDFPLRAAAPLADGDEKLDELLENRSALIMAICRAALPYLQKSPAGRIINVGFLRSVFAVEGGDAFRQSERDLQNLTLALAAETGEHGITANYVQPGAIMTPVSREVFRKDIPLRDYCIRSSAARRLGEPVDVAKVALFLASEDAAFVNGTGVLVDGGRKSA